MPPPSPRAFAKVSHLEQARQHRGRGRRPSAGCDPGGSGRINPADSELRGSPEGYFAGKSRHLDLLGMQIQMYASELTLKATGR